MRWSRVALLLLAFFPPLLAFYPWLSIRWSDRTPAEYEALDPAAHAIADHYRYCQRLATQLATLTSRTPNVDPRVGAEELANVLAPFVPYPFESILVFDASGQVVGRVRSGREKTPITADETSGIEEAALATGAIIQFDPRRSLVRFFEPTVREGARQGFLCLEARILPDENWFLIRGSQVVLGEEPNEALRGRAFLEWVVSGVGSDRIVLCRFQRAQTRSLRSIAAYLVVAVALQLAVLLILHRFSSSPGPERS